jgi:tRNA G37 N-methylase Trm5
MLEAEIVIDKMRIVESLSHSSKGVFINSIHATRKALKARLELIKTKRSLNAYFRCHSSLSKESYGKIAGGIVMLILVDVVQLAMPKVMQYAIDSIQERRIDQNGLIWVA